MFEKIAELLSKQNLLVQAAKECRYMLELDIEMFQNAKDAIRNKAEEQAKFDIYKHDKKVNKLERSVRRNILTHLAVSNRLDLNHGLVLISIVIDLERIGDYTKNIYELGKTHPGVLNPGPWSKEIKNIEKELENALQTLINLFEMKEPKLEIAKELMRGLIEYNKQLDSFIEQIVTGKLKDFSSSDSAVLTLYLRYLKRICSHLKNVASSIVNPMHRIGYKPKKKKHTN